MEQGPGFDPHLAQRKTITNGTPVFGGSTIAFGGLAFEGHHSPFSYGQRSVMEPTSLDNTTYASITRGPLNALLPPA